MVAKQVCQLERRGASGERTEIVVGARKELAPQEEREALAVPRGHAALLRSVESKWGDERAQNEMRGVRRVG